MKAYRLANSLPDPSHWLESHTWNPLHALARLYDLLTEPMAIVHHYALTHG